MKTIHLRNGNSFQTVSDIHFIFTRDSDVKVMFTERFTGSVMEFYSIEIDRIS